MNGTERIAWTRYTGYCQGCRRRFRITLDALAKNREHLIAAQGADVSEDNSDADIATQFEFCMECSGGCRDTGEFINDNPYAARWDPKGWALETLRKMASEVLDLTEVRLTERELVTYRTRLRRRAFVAEALRARIDGRY